MTWRSAPSCSPRWRRACSPAGTCPATSPPDSRAAVGHFLKPTALSETYLSRARALNEIASGRGQSLAQLALSWVLRDDRITSALVGASSVAQLEDNVKALSAAPLTADEIASIDPHAVDGTGR